MKVALCFWGLTRSLKFTIDSIREFILKPLDDNNIEYTIFLHTFSMSSKYYNPRAGEENIQLDFDEHHLLSPDFLKIDDQDEIKEQIQIKKYRTLPDPWNTNYICLDNFICAMYSKKQLGIMVKESNIHFDYVVYLRPDVRYITPIDQRYFHVTHQNTICTPNFHLFPNLNDRLAIITSSNLKTYSEMFNEMYEYSRIYPLHSERFQYNIITRRFRWKVQYIPIHFNRVRADGREEPDTRQYYAKLHKMMEQNESLSVVSDRKPAARKMDMGVTDELHRRTLSEFNTKSMGFFASPTFSSRYDSNTQPHSTAVNEIQSLAFLKASPKNHIPENIGGSIKKYNPQIINEQSSKRIVPKPEICGTNSTKSKFLANVSSEKSSDIKRAVQPMFRSRKSTAQSS